jgi:hypothetical protein
MVLNNNDSRNGKISSVEIFEQPANLKEKIKSKWSFKFNFDSLNSGKSFKLGNVKILDNGHLLINQGSNNRIVEITKDQEILWDMMIYRKDSALNKWVDFGCYKIDFSSSLYPYYYSIGVSQITEKKISITIFNEGDYADNYKCELLDENKKTKFSVNKTSEVKSKSELTIDFGVEPSKKYTLRIKSLESGIVKELPLKQ